MLIRAIVCFLVICGLCYVSRAAVIGIDFGTEYIKVASVKPGTPFHIVLDEQAKRKVPAIVAFDQEERLFGNHAVALMSRKPKDVFAYTHRLLGKKLNSPDVKLMKAHGYPYELVEMPERGGGVGIRYKDRVYSPEEMVAMQLEYIKKISVDDAEGQLVKDCVITVPVFFSQTERQALLDAAALAGLNVLSLINDNTAAAVQYGIDRKYSENETHTAVFYNMGSSSTQVTLAKYSGYVKPDGKKEKTVGQFEVEAVSWDEFLGGESFDMRIVDLMIAHYDKTAKTKVDLRTNDRAMAKMRSAANKAKTVLSANTETGISIEGLVADTDFKMKLTREQMYDACSDLFTRAVAPLKSVFTTLNIKPSDIDAFVPIGGNTRIPGIQTAIKAFMGREDLNAVLNGDEAMAMGAVFRAANLSTAFQVRKFGLVDMTVYPVGVRIQDMPSASSSSSTPIPEPTDANEDTAADNSADDADGDSDATKSSKPDAKPIGSNNGVFSKRASLFRRENRLSKRKTVTLTHDKDFYVSMHHDSPKLLPKGISAGIAVYNVTGVNALMANPEYKELLSTQTPRVALSFSLDGSGMVSLVKAEATLDEIVKTPVLKKTPKVENATEANSTTTAKDESTDSSSDTTSSSDKEKDTEKDKDTSDKDKEDKDENNNDGESETKPPTDDATTSSTSSSSTESGKDKDSTSDDTVEYKTKKVTRHINLDIEMGGYIGSVAPLTTAQVKAGKDLLKKLTEADMAKKEIAAAKNNVESFIYSTRGKLEDEEVEAVSTESQREAVSEALTNAEDWLSTQAEDEAKKFKKKLDELHKVWDPIAFRMVEMIERPQAINASQQLSAYTRDLLEKMEKERPWIPKDEREQLLNMTNEVDAWLAARLEEQDKLEAHDTPAFSSHELIEKLRPIAKLSTQLTKRKKPKEKPPAPKLRKNATATNSTDDFDINLEDIKLNDTDEPIEVEVEPQPTNSEPTDTAKDEL